MQRHAPSDVAAIGFGVARRRGAFVAWRLKPRLGGRSPPARADEAAPAAFARPPITLSIGPLSLPLSLRRDGRWLVQPSDDLGLQRWDLTAPAAAPMRLPRTTGRFHPYGSSPTMKDANRLDRERRELARRTRTSGTTTCPWPGSRWFALVRVLRAPKGPRFPLTAAPPGGWCRRSGCAGRLIRRASGPRRSPSGSGCPRSLR